MSSVLYNCEVSLHKNYCKCAALSLAYTISCQFSVFQPLCLTELLALHEVSGVVRGMDCSSQQLGGGDKNRGDNRKSGGKKQQKLGQ